MHVLHLPYCELPWESVYKSSVCKARLLWHRFSHRRLLCALALLQLLLRLHTQGKYRTILSNVELIFQVIYITIVAVMGVTCVIVSLWDKFGSPRLRPFRAGIFITFGLSGIAPATHYSIQNGWEKSINEAALGWLVFMGFLYISGAMLYAFRSPWSIRGVCFIVYLCRIPERFFPGKVDIVFHSHQLFHCFVIAGAFVHYHGISNMALHRYYINLDFFAVWYLTNHMIMQAPHWRVPSAKDRPVSLCLIISHCDMLLILPSRVQPLLEKWISMKNTKQTPVKRSAYNC